jgi:ABC-type multidrug transport system fused ATPase/permease subunit
VVGDRGVRLSGGQKQRISIARAILMEPRILILDEATAFLDASVEEQLKETIRLLMQGKTIIVISHRLSTIQGVDKIIALEKDGIVYEGPSAAFFQNRADDSEGISEPLRLISSDARSLAPKIS